MVREKSSVAVYDQNAEFFLRQYESLDFHEVHADILDLLPNRASLVIDIGAGSGRDAHGLARLGYVVDAVEPAAEMRKRAQALHPDPNIRWIDDRLPKLRNVVASGRRYALVLLSAVWMHIEPNDRPDSMKTLTRILDTDGILVITLRLGPPEPSRDIYPVSEDELLGLAKENKLVLLRLTNAKPDSLNREGITWKTAVFKRARISTSVLGINGDRL